jgi:hypothetical protein
MAAKQQKINDFVSICTLEKNIYHSPILYSRDAAGKLRSWQIHIALEKAGKYQACEEYADGSKTLPDDLIGVYWTVSGQVGTVNPNKSNKTEIVEGKGLGKKGATNAFTQALFEALSNYNKMVKKGAVTNQNNLKSKDKYTLNDLMVATHRGEGPWRVFVALAHDVNVNKRWEKIRWPMRIQPKLDGTLQVMVYIPAGSGVDADGETVRWEGRLEIYSRGRKNPGGFDYIMEEGTKLLKNYPGLHLVCEVWKSGLGLQEVSGASRRTASSSRGAAEQLYFNVFDCFYIDQPTMIYSSRRKLLEKVFVESLLKTPEEGLAIMLGKPYKAVIKKTAAKVEDDTSDNDDTEDDVPVDSDNDVEEADEADEEADEEAADEEADEDDADEEDDQPKASAYYPVKSTPSAKSAPLTKTAPPIKQPIPRLIRLMPEWTVKNKNEATVLYRSFLKEGLEGAILRNPDGVYEFGIDKEKRSEHILKFKPREDAEWPVVSYKVGVGREKNAITWTCAANDTTSNPKPLNKRRIFHVVPNGSIEGRDSLYAKLGPPPEKIGEFPKSAPFAKIYGKMLVIQYSTISNDEIPQQPKALRFHDPEVDELVAGWRGEEIGSDEE